MIPFPNAVHPKHALLDKTARVTWTSGH